MKKISLIILLCAATIAQTPVTINGFLDAEYFDLKSKSVDETFRIYVAKPSPLVPDKKYPVVYVLDGDLLFGTAMETVRNLSGAGLGIGEIPMAYTVAIGYKDANNLLATFHKRWRDYTPNIGGEAEKMSKLMGGPSDISGGGAPDFLKFLQEELKPLIESKYSVDPIDATIAGLSLGGLFPSWVLLTQPETFQRYVIMSPSIWWNGEEVWEWESRFAQNHNDINAKVFVTAGGLETIEIQKKMMDDILKEQGFQQTGCATSECAVEVGNMLGVQQMIGGSIGKLGDMYTVSVRIIDVETGTVLNTANHDHIGGIEKLGMMGMKDVAIKLFGDSKDLADLEKRKSSKDASCVALGVVVLLILLISSDSEEDTGGYVWNDW